MKNFYFLCATFCCFSAFAQKSSYSNDFTGLNPSVSAPTIRCFQAGKQIVQEVGQFVANKQSGANIYRFGDTRSGVNILIFNLGESMCTLTKLSSK